MPRENVTVSWCTNTRTPNASVWKRNMKGAADEKQRVISSTEIIQSSHIQLGGTAEYTIYAFIACPMQLKHSTSSGYKIFVFLVSRKLIRLNWD